MQTNALGVRVLAILVCLAAWRQADPASQRIYLDGVPQAWPAHQPDLATASWRELASLPGVGLARAKSITAGRAYLGVSLCPQLLSLIPGIGEQTQAAITAALAAQESVGPG